MAATVVRWSAKEWSASILSVASWAPGADTSLEGEDEGGEGGGDSPTISPALSPFSGSTPSPPQCSPGAPMEERGA